MYMCLVMYIARAAQAAPAFLFVVLRIYAATLASWARRYYRSDYTRDSPWRGRVSMPKSPPGIRPGEGVGESLAVLI